MLNDNINIIIEYEKENSFFSYSQGRVNRPNYIAIGHDSRDDLYYLMYNETFYQMEIENVLELFEILGSIKVNVLPEFGMGLDGDRYIIRVSNGWNSLEYKWWSDTCGKQWKELFVFRKKLIELRDKFILK